MPEEVRYDPEQKLIHVNSWGHVTIDDWNSSREAVIRLYRRYRAGRVLVDVTRQVSAPSTLEIFDFGAEWPASIRTAVVTGAATRAEQQFLETVAMNRARPLRVFDDRDTAIAWLDSGLP
ncbi:MAG: STAS/SEC14 domain-containing protein [Pseudomonadota bacterium]